MNQDLTPLVPDTELNYSPAVAQSKDDIVQQDQKPKAGFFAAAGAAFLNDNSAAQLNVKSQSDFLFEEDFDFDSYVKQDHIKSRLEALPENTQIAMGEVIGQEHFDYLLGYAEEEQMREEMIASAGGKGMAARLLANLLDPVDLAVIGISGPLGLLKKGTRAQNIVRGGLVGGAAVAGVEAAVAYKSPLRDETDVLYGALAGLALGGALGSLAKVDQAKINAIINGRKQGSAGAAYNRYVKEGDVDIGEVSEDLSVTGIKALDDAIDLEYAPELHAVKFRFGLARALIGSASEKTRALGARIMETGAIKGHGVRKHTAEGRANNIQREQLTAIHAGMESSFKEFSEQNGYGYMRRNFGWKAGKEFAEQVDAAVVGTPGLSPQAYKSAQVIQKGFRNQMEMMKEAGIKGSDDIVLDANFRPRVVADSKLSDMLAEIGEPGIVQLMVNSIFIKGDMTPELEALRLRMAKGYAKNLIGRHRGMDMGMHHGVSLDDYDSLRQFFNDPADAEAAIQAIEAMKRSKGGDTNRITELKMRVDLDEVTSVRIGDKDYSVRDFLETDIRKTTARYMQTTSGWIGLAKEANIKSPAQVDLIKQGMISQGIKDGRNKDEVIREVDAFQQSIDLLVGRSLDENPNSRWNQTTRTVRGLNFTRLGGGFGWAQLAEIGNVVGFAGWKNTLAHVPALRKMLSRDYDGKLRDELAAEMEYLHAPGTDLIRNPVFSGFDEIGQDFSGDTIGKALSKVDGPIRSASRGVAVISGMAPITATLQRLGAKAMVQRLAHHAMGWTKLTKKQANRLRDAGWDESGWTKFTDEMKTHADWDGKVLKKLNYEQWDKDVLDSFRLSMNRINRRTVQENDIGNSFLFMHKEYGKVMTQFQSFMVNAWTKQLIHGMKYRDVQTFSAYTSSMFFAGMAYIGQNTLNYSSQPELLAERLEPANIVKASFMRAGFASMLPMAYDFTAERIGFDKQFDKGRSSGLGTGLATANPTVALIGDLGESLSLPMKLLHDDYTLSQQDISRAVRPLPFSNVTGVRNGIAFMRRDLPLYSQDKYK